MYATVEYVDRVETRLNQTMNMLREDIKAVGDTTVELLQSQKHLETRLGSLETKVDGLDVRVGSLETKVDRLDVRVGNLETKVDRLDSNVLAIMRHLGVPAMTLPAASEDA